MAQMRKLEVQTEIKTNPDKFYAFMRDNLNGLAKVLPQHFIAVELLQGNAGSAGAVHVLKYVIGAEMTVKVVVDKVDDENKLVSYTALEGDYQKMFKSLAKTIEVKKGENGVCFAKWTIVYEKAFEGAPDANAYADLVATINKHVDAYLLSN